MNTLGQKENKEMTLLQKWSIFASNASLPWTIFIGILAVGPIYSGKELVENLQNNYQAKSERIVKPYSNTSYQCGEGVITQYICEDITEIVERGDKSLNISHIFRTKIVDDKPVTEIDGSTIQLIKTQFETFLEKYPDNFHGELKVIGGLKKYDFKDPESISTSARESDLESILLLKELEGHIPRLKDQIKAQSKQEYLSEEQRNQFLKDLHKLGYSGGFDLDAITHFFLFTHPKFESEENQKLNSELFRKYFGEIKLNLSGDNVVGRYVGSSLTSPLYLLILSLFVTLLYVSIFLPLSGSKKIRIKLLIAEYGKIQNGVNSKEESETINKYRKVLGYQSYNDAVRMFNELGGVSNGKIIRKKGLDGLVFLKNNGTIQGLSLNKEGKYNLSGSPIDNNLTLLYTLEEYGFTIENIEVADGASLSKDFAS